MPNPNLGSIGKPWNKGELTGQKPPLKLKEIWAIWIRLQIARQYRDLALFNLAIDSKLRSCDLVKISVKDVTHGATVAKRAIVVQQKTGKPVQFEITAQTRDSILEWINRAELMTDDYLFKGRNRESAYISTRQYARLVDNWVRDIGLDPGEYGTHSLLRTKASLIHRRTKNLRAVQILLGHTKDGKHGQIPGHRGGRRSGDGGTDRNLTRNRPETPSGAFLGFP
jgi:integrase